MDQEGNEGRSRGARSARRNKRTGSNEERIAVKHSQRRERSNETGKKKGMEGRTTHLRLESFSKNCEASAITVDHIPLSLRFYSLGGNARKPQTLAGETSRLVSASRVKNLSALKLIRLRARASAFAGCLTFALIEKKISNRDAPELTAPPVI